LSVGDSFLVDCRGGRIRRTNPLHTVGVELDEMARDNATVVAVQALAQVRRASRPRQPGDLTNHKW